MDAATAQTRDLTPKPAGQDSQPTAFGPAAFLIKPAPASAAATAPALAPWPKSAQWTAAVLLAGVVILLACHALAGMRVRTRVSDLDPGGPIYRLDLNRARVAELVQLPGVGTQLAERILAYRNTQGPFRSINDLRQVSGIGAKTLERIRPYVCLETDLPAASAFSSSLSPRPSRALSASPTISGKSRKEAGLTGVVINVNEATAGELQRLPRIGPMLSQRIIEERARGAFRSIDDLRRVKGIGPKTLDKLRPFISVHNAPAQLATTAGE
jgi:competence protein ComEA